MHQIVFIFKKTTRIKSHAGPSLKIPFFNPPQFFFYSSKNHSQKFLIFSSFIEFLRHASAIDSIITIKTCCDVRIYKWWSLFFLWSHCCCCCCVNRSNKFHFLFRHIYTSLNIDYMCIIYAHMMTTFSTLFNSESKMSFGGKYWV